MERLAAILFVSISTVLYALLQPIWKKVGIRVTPFATMATAMFVLSLTSLILSLLSEKGQMGKLFTIHRQELSLLVIAGIINLVGFWLMIHAFKHLQVWQVSSFGLLVPLLAGIFAYVLLGEKLTLNLFVGLVIMGVGLIIAMR